MSGEAPAKEPGQGLAGYVDIRFLEPAEARFGKTPGGFLKLEIGEESYPRVLLYRTFPFSTGNRYLSVRDPEGNEIGIIKEIDDFPQDVVDAFEAELERRYFAPTVTAIDGMKEEFGYAYWEVDTDRGPRRFTVRDMQQSVLLLSSVHVLIVDVDGNRYDIPDYTVLDAASRKVIDDLL